MNKERFIILSGILVALVFFYIGLNEWLKSKEEKVQPPPLVVKPAVKPAPTPQQAKEEKPQENIAKPEAPKTKEEAQPKKDLIAQKIKEEKQKVEVKEEKPQVKETPKQEVKKEEATKKAETKKEAVKARAVKTYTVQVGAFKNREGAEKTLKKATSMGYKANIVEEDGFYKVRLSVKTDNIKGELQKLRSAFGSAILK